MTAPPARVRISARGIGRTYPSVGTSPDRRARATLDQVQALRDINLDVHVGEVVALVGPSGSGKTTLLTILAGWERPDTGSLIIDPELGAADPALLNWSKLAIVPQFLGALDDLSVRENVMLPAKLAGLPNDAVQLLRTLDLAPVADRYPSETSLGEQQRAVVARALALSPAIILADEPTTHQDSLRAKLVLSALQSAAHYGSAVVIATHDPMVLASADMRVRLQDGNLAT